MAQVKGDPLSKTRDLFERAGLGKLFLPSAAVVLLAILVIALLAAWRFWPSGQEADSFLVQEASAQGASVAAGQSEAVVVVDVAGAVICPGVYELAEGSRVNDAIAMAGGFSPQAATSSINLARILIDAEQIYVPVQDEQPAVGTRVAAVPGGSHVQSLVNINAADIDTLCTLTGIGEATAQKIIDDRENNGPFIHIEDLQRVGGIGEKKFAQIKDHICV